MSDIGDNNPPAAVVELSQEEYDFLVANCDSNIMLGLNVMQEMGYDMSEEALRELVDLTEKFKKLKDKLQEAAK